jgi:aryl-alcohol dehydrogenase-like predicted oxidoreductase
MEQRQFGQLGTISALTLGGGGIGQVWGRTTRDEAVATVREAVERGITFIDLAPGYGRGEAEMVLGDAFGGRLPEGVRVSTKCFLGAPPADEVASRLETSLSESLERMRLDHVDLFFLHGMVVPDDRAGLEGYRGTPRSLFVDAVRPAFEALVAAGRIGAWGISGIGVPSAVIATVEDDPPPAAVQCVANLLDSPGGMKTFPEPARPREIIAAANRRGVAIMGIRAVQAGALTDAIDRDLPADHPEMRDFQRAAPFRALARELGLSPALLAHRYALSMPGVATVILGVKDRVELRECLDAEAEGPLPKDLVDRIDRAVGRVGPSL